MDKNKIFWGLLITALVALCAFNIKRNHELERNLKRLNEVTVPDYQKLALASVNASVSHAGHILRWPADLEILGEGPARLPSPGYRVVLAFSEMSCDTCRDEQTQFLKKLSHDLEPGAIAIVVHATSKRYARAYMRLNQLNIPVHFDESGAFFKANNIKNTPLLFMINERDEVLASHHPVTGEPWLSMPFHKMVSHFFIGRENGS